MARESGRVDEEPGLPRVIPLNIHCFVLVVLLGARAQTQPPLPLGYPFLRKG
jgi:hypothetical protein